MEIFRAGDVEDRLVMSCESSLHTLCNVHVRGILLIYTVPSLFTENKSCHRITFYCWPGQKWGQLAVTMCLTVTQYKKLHPWG